LALVIQGWTFERKDGKGDGKVAGGIRELKKNGASLKPLAKELRVQNELNKMVFQGNRPGPLNPNTKSKGQSFARWEQWFKAQSNQEQILLEYFTNLYPGRDVVQMCTNLMHYKDGKDFYNIIGREVLKWYNEVDKWDSLIIIKEEEMIMTNIADVNNLTLFKNIKFEWKSERGADTQAITDGYVNIKI
jgi:hypothetical protein